jgi:hypothetical protein
MKRYFLAANIALLLGTAGLSSQDDRCLHGASETADQAVRRRMALDFARQVNSAEAALRTQERRFGSYADLPDLPEAPQGFQAPLVSNGTMYMFAVKDTTDPCYFVLFSDQSGVIYTGTAIR